MKDVVLMITFTVSNEKLNSEDFKDFLDHINSGNFRDEMIDDLFEDIQVKYAIYKSRKNPRQEKQGE
jgi:hypothetical protein